MARIVNGPLLTGAVVSRQTGAPLAGTTVTVSATVYTDPELSSGATTTVTTDGRGVFSCYAKPGTYTFTCADASAAPIESIEVLSPDQGNQPASSGTSGPARRGGTTTLPASLWAWNVKDYGAVGDGRRVTNATITSGQNTVTSATAAFTAGDVGKVAVFDGAAAAGAVLATTIASYVSPTQVTLTANAATTVAANGNFFCATDDATAINNALTDAAATGGIVWTPPGLYGITATITVPGGVTLEGVGIDYATTSWYPLRGSILVCATAALNPAVSLGSDQSSSSSGATAPKLRGLIVDGANLATNVVKTMGRRSRIERCQVYSGTASSIWLSGQNGYIDRTIAGQRAVGICFNVGNNDNKLISCEGRQAATIIQIQGSGTMIVGGHYYSGIGAGCPGAGNDIVINPLTAQPVNDTVITGVTFDACKGHHIVMVPASSATIDSVTITGCSFYQSAGIGDNTAAMIRLDPTAASSRISAVSIVGNTGQGVTGTERITSICSVNTGSGTTSGITVVANTLRYGVVATSGAGVVDGSKHGNAVYNGTTTAYTTNGGTSTKSGDGSTTAFTIAHGLTTTPKEFLVTAGSAVAAAPFYTTADATNITVTFVTAPVSGASNLVLNWRAQT